MAEYQKYPFRVLITEKHLDTFGHVNNAVYLQLFEEARWDFMYNNGMGVKEIVELGIGPTILEIRIRFSKELLLRQEIVIESQVISHLKKIFVIHQKMKAGDTSYCTAEFKIALFDTKARKLVAPNDDWCRAIGRIDLPQTAE